MFLKETFRKRLAGANGHATNSHAINGHKMNGTNGLVESAEHTQSLIGTKLSIID